MKKIFLALAFVLLFASYGWTANLKSVGNTADAAITATGGYLKGFIVHTDGTNSVTLAVYDHATEASGNQLFSTITITTSATNRVTTISFNDHECLFVKGIYVDITTSGSVTYDVYFESN